MRSDSIMSVNDVQRDIDISVLVRTIGRPQVLNEALLSLRSQNFKNFEIVIVEDGPEISKDFIFSNFSDLQIQYFCSGTKVGRIRAGNLCLQKAKGEYLIFLDDDDIFFPNHLEILFNALKREKDYKAAYSIAYEVPTTIVSIDPYIFKEKNTFIRFCQPFNLLMLFLKNYIPIQTLLFHRSLYEQYGGFDENLGFLEDWDLWMRFAAHNAFKFIPEITSKYRVPAENNDWEERSAKFEISEKIIRAKQKEITLCITASESVNEIQMITRESIRVKLKFLVHHPFKGFIQLYRKGFYLSFVFPR